MGVKVGVASQFEFEIALHCSSWSWAGVDGEVDTEYNILASEIFVTGDKGSHKELILAFRLTYMNQLQFKILSDYHILQVVVS